MIMMTAMQPELQDSIIDEVMDVMDAWDDIQRS